MDGWKGGKKDGRKGKKKHGKKEGLLSARKLIHGMKSSISLFLFFKIHSPVLFLMVASLPRTRTNKSAVKWAAEHRFRDTISRRRDATPKPTATTAGTRHDHAPRRHGSANRYHIHAAQHSFNSFEQLQSRLQQTSTYPK